MKLILQADQGMPRDENLGFLVLNYLDQARACGLPSDALDPILRAIASVDLWYGDVLNGGHSQFLGNKQAQAVPILEDVIRFLRYAQADDYVAVVEMALRWAQANPTRATRETGFHGGSARALQAIDDVFYGLHQTQPVSTFLGKAVRNWPGLTLASKETWAGAVRAEALEVLAKSSALQDTIAKDVARMCRAWLTDPFNIGLSLAAGKLDCAAKPIKGFGPFQNPETGQMEHNVALYPLRNGVVKGEARKAVFSEQGFVLFAGDGLQGAPEIKLSRREIERAMKMALAFRLPESVGLRWSRMGQRFGLGSASFKVMPGQNWLPHKYRVMWICPGWAVKGSPNRSTFAALAGESPPETLLQTEIAARITSWAA